MNDGEFLHLGAVAKRSWLVRTANQTIGRLAASGHSSATARRLTAGLTTFAALPASRKLRLSAMTFGWAAFLYWCALAVIPPYTATGLPRTGFLAVAIGAWLVAANAVTVARAWPASRVAGALRWLVT